MLKSVWDNLVYNISICEVSCYDKNILGIKVLITSYVQVLKILGGPMWCNEHVFWFSLVFSAAL